MNVNRGKTEVMLFGNLQQLKLHEDSLPVVYGGTIFNVVSQYKYFGTIVDNHLSLSSNFDKTYVTASSGLRLLQCMRVSYE